MPHYEFFCRTCKKTFSICWPWSIGRKERSPALTAVAMTSSKCGRPFRFSHPRTAREVDLPSFRGRLR